MQKPLTVKCKGGCGRQSPDLSKLFAAGGKLGFKRKPTWTCAECYRKEKRSSQ